MDSMLTHFIIILFVVVVLLGINKLVFQGKKHMMSAFLLAVCFIIVLLCILFPSFRANVISLIVHEIEFFKAFLAKLFKAVKAFMAA
ncbi:MAG: hypothetical protein LBR73_05440 [Oscillospiraceae bacterium]|jgi:uncharacterized membrane protein YdfJ with MMPL/SSD domain|nr:hypothetical protein [Oscillospiraceae bacterium]